MASARARTRTAVGVALATLGTLTAVIGLGPHVLGDCVLWCFLGRGGGAGAAGVAGVAVAVVGLIVLRRKG